MIEVNEKKRTISGPYNAVRMEGEINGIRKIVYLFMDVHLNMENQRRCRNVLSLDINQYFAQKFHELNGSDKMYDFFFEISPTAYKVDNEQKANIKKPQCNIRDIYIKRIMKLIRSAVKYDSHRDLVQVSDVFQNVRLHYLDIRRTLGLIHADITRMSFFTDINRMSFPPSLFKILTDVKNKLEQVTTLFRLIRDNRDYIRSDDFESSTREMKILGKYIQKLLYVYNHPNVQKEIVSIVNKSFDELSKAIEMVDDCIRVFRSYQKILSVKERIHFPRKNAISDGIPLEQRLEIFNDSIERYESLIHQTLRPSTDITDCYLLRRLLDKDYVTNAIIYSGGNHTLNYIHNLALYFQFNITHVVYSSTTISELNDKMKDRFESDQGIADLFIDVNDPKPQCIDMTGFPTEFE